MDKMIYTSLNSINSLIRDRLNISQNLANVSVTGYRKDTGQEQITSFVNEYDALSTRVMSSKIGPNGFSNGSRCQFLSTATHLGGKCPPNQS